MTETATYRAELLSRLRQASDDLAWAVRGLAGNQARFTPAGGEWSIHEHLSHVFDMEQEVCLPLLRWATVPDMLDPLDYSRKEWHERRYRPDQPLAEIMADIGRIRDEELAIFRGIGDIEWARWRTETRWGPLTCQWIAELMYRHVLDHLQGIMALRQEIHLESHRPPPAVVGGYIGGRG